MSLGDQHPATEEEEDEHSRVKRITPKVLKELIKDQQLYKTPSLNDKLYLHYHGFERIEGLDEWTGLRALWLEGNGLDKIEGLGALTSLRCLYLHQNCVKRIENLEVCPQLATLQLANNFITRIENLHQLSRLSTLQIAHNHLTTVEDLRELLRCPSLTVVDLQNNRLEETGVIDVFEAMPQLAVLQLQGNPFISKVESYRKVTISRCKTLTYLDDRPVFEEERMAIEAWAIGGLAAEREQRSWHRQEKDAAHRRNIENMMAMWKENKEKAGRGGTEGEAADAEEEVEVAPQSRGYPVQSERRSEKEMYESALAAVDKKRRELLKAKQERERAEAGLEAAAEGADDETAEGEAAEKEQEEAPEDAEEAGLPPIAGSGSKFGAASAAEVVGQVGGASAPVDGAASGVAAPSAGADDLDALD